MNAGIIGYGKMGREIEIVLKERGDNVVFIADDFCMLKELLEKYSNSVDIVYEFTEPSSAYENIIKCIEYGVRVVSGTTGWLDRLEELKGICKEVGGTVLWSSNFSISVNLFFRINRYASKLFNKFSQYDIMVEETHHKWKKDKPSGTAIMLIKDIIDNVERKDRWKLLEEDNEERGKDTLYVKANRYEDVFGIHNVRFYDDKDEIEISHKLRSRRSLAEGAVLAGYWLRERVGFYSMDDYIDEIIKNKEL